MELNSGLRAPLVGVPFARRLVATCLVLVAICCSHAPCFAQTNPLDGLELNDIMVTRLRKIRYQVSIGRIVASSSAVGNINDQLTSTRGNRSESFTHVYTQDTSLTNLNFVLTGPAGELTINVVDSYQFDLRRATADGNFVLELHQAPKQPIVLTVQDQGVKQVWQGLSFWHLCLASPQTVRKQLIPLLELLNPSWQLRETCEDAEKALVRLAGDARPVGARQQWATWLNDLGHENFAARQSAERQLLDAGQMVLPYLMFQDSAKLDREQVYRVRSIIERLNQGEDDTPDRIALWMYEDEQIWLSLLGRDELERRKLAAKQLSAILGAPIDFDPAADEKARQSQIDRLRAKLRKT